MLNWIAWNRTVYRYKIDLVLNNLQWLICHKTKPNQTKLMIMWFQAFLSNTNNYMVLSKWFYLIRINCLHSYIVSRIKGKFDIAPCLLTWLLSLCHLMNRAGTHFGWPFCWYTVRVRCFLAVGEVRWGLMHLQRIDCVFYSPSQLGHVGEVLALCREADSVFYSPYRLGDVGEVLALCREADSVFYSTSKLGHVGEVLALCRDAVSVFYSRRRLSNI